MSKKFIFFFCLAVTNACFSADDRDSLMSSSFISKSLDNYQLSQNNEEISFPDEPIENDFPEISKLLLEDEESHEPTSQAEKPTEPHVFQKVLLTDRTLPHALEIGKIKPVVSEDAITGYKYETPDGYKILKLFGKVNGDTVSYNIKGEKGDFTLSNVFVIDSIGARVALHRDEVSIQIAKGKNGLLKDMGFACISAEEDVDMNTFNASFGVSLTQSIRQSILCTTNEAHFRGAFLRTPVGIFLKAKSKHTAIISEIAILPKKYNYPKVLDGGNIQESRTAFVNGNVDFVTGLMDLEVHNAHLHITFNKGLLS